MVSKVISKAFNLSSIIGKRLETIKTFLLEVRSECLYRGPSLILLDDLDCLCRQPQEERTSEQEKNHLERF